MLAVWLATASLLLIGTIVQGAPASTTCLSDDGACWKEQVPGCSNFTSTDGYTGTRAHTKDGYECQAWNVQLPHKHNYSYLGQHNYCRATADVGSRPWCYTNVEWPIWQECFPSCMEEKSCLSPDSTCWKKNAEYCLTQGLYSGTKSTTKDGYQCQAWNVNTPHKHVYQWLGNHNYCRSGDDGYGPWCYVADPTGPIWQECFPACTENVQCQPADQSCWKEDLKACLAEDQYKGHKNTTQAGVPCQAWNVNIPHSHGYKYVGVHNECRSTDNGYGPWCYTTDPNVPWDLCYPPCNS